MKTLVDVFDAVKARLSAVPLLVVDGDPKIDPNTSRYVVLNVDPGNLSSDFDARSNHTTLYFRPMFVGTSQRACLDAVQQGRDALEKWNIFPDEPAASLVEEEETTPPILPSTSVAGAFRWTITPTYRLRLDR